MKLQAPTPFLLTVLCTALSLCLPSLLRAQQLPGSVPLTGGSGFPELAKPTGEPLPLRTPALQVPPAGARFSLTSVRIAGNKVFSSEELLLQMALVLDSGTTSFEDLSRAVDRISRFYRAKGYMAARAYIPRQEVAEGVLQVTVVEGVHAEPKIKNTSHVKTPVIQRLVAQALCDGKTITCVDELITDSQVDRMFRLLNDLPGVMATSSFVPSLAFGTGALDIDVRPSPHPKGNVGVDNYGSKYTGTYRVNAAQEWNNLQGEGDQLLLSGAASDQHIWSGALGYSLLAGYSGTRMGVTLSHGQYLLGDAFKNLNAHGNANTVSIFASHPIIRHRDYNLAVRGSMDHKVLRDSIEISNKHFDKRNNTHALSLSGDLVDTFAGGGYNTLMVAASGGKLRLLDADSMANDSTAQTAGVYRKLTYATSRQQALGGGWTLYGAVAGQHASKNLDGSEKIGLGGPGAVRGYPLGEGAGDRGGVGNIELRRTHVVGGNSTLTFTVFSDYGWVQTNANPWSTSANTQVRKGYGLGLLYIKPHDYTLRLLYAGHSASAPSTADPAAKRQFWLQGSKSF